MTAMKEKPDIDKMMLGLGFSKRCDAIGGGYKKEIVLCNSNCVGCEYRISFNIHVFKDGSCNVAGIMYKPLVRAGEIGIGKDGSSSDHPHSSIFVLSTERGDIENAVFDCAYTLAQVMIAMDFHQLSGTDFIDFSDCSRGEIMNELEKQSYTKIHVKFKSKFLVPSGE